MAHKAKRVINHRFFDKHTVAGALFLWLWSTLFVLVVGSCVGGIGAIYVIFHNMDLSAEDTDLLISCFGMVSIPFAFCALAIHKRWFYPEYQGCLRGGNRKAMLSLAALAFAYWVPTIALQLISTGGYARFVPEGVAVALTAGVCEEVICRGLPASYLMRQLRDEKSIPLVVVSTSVAFGVVHLTNLASGADPLMTVIQVVSAGCMGLFLCAIFLRSGNLLPCMAVHFLNNLLFIITTPAEEVGMYLEGANWYAFVDAALCIALGGLGMYLVRPEKRAEVRALWDAKWGRS